MTPLYPVQLLARTQKWINGDRTPDTGFYYLILALFNRTGGQSGVPLTVGPNIEASGVNQGFILANDFNEVLTGSGGVALAALQPGQFQLVYNGLGGNLNVWPSSADGTIDSITAGSPYVLATTKTQIFWCASLLTTGGSSYRSVQLG